MATNHSTAVTPSTSHALSGPFLPIAAVERDTGLSKDTLRVWERRYGFPQPLRDPHGERTYPPEQIERLHLISRLLTSGERPGKVVTMSLDALKQRMSAAVASTPAAPQGPAELQLCLTQLRQHDVQQLRRTLNQALLVMGLARFVTELLGPLNRQIGEAWMRGEIRVFEEHLYTECVSSLMRQAITQVTTSVRPAGPRVLLSTIPQESHGLGLLMAESVLALEGCDCISLGVQTPLPEIVSAAVAQQVQIVALSFSVCPSDKQVLASLTELRLRLPQDVSLWVGGSHAALARLEIAGVTPAQDLNQIRPLLAQWRAQNPAGVSATG